VLIELGGALDDLVVDVGVVAYVEDIVGAPQIAHHHIEGHVGACMPMWLKS